ncbi:MAG: hypothetical protein V1678_00645 [Candidatus Aenigmatarchaeota archaeon]
MKNAAITIAIIVVVFLLIASMGPFEPKEFVNEKEVLNTSSILFNYKIIRYPTSGEIISFNGDNIGLGVVTDPWNIKFGSVLGNGSTIKRYISIKNSQEKYSRISLKAYGNITSLVKFSKNNFVLTENESSAVEIVFDTGNSSYGNYTGEIDVVFKTPKYDLLQIFT